MAANQYLNVGITDYGTQWFWFNKDNTFKDGQETGGTTGAFEYALPVTAGAEFGGDTESFELKETDLDNTAKKTGRRTVNDVEYTLNYTGEKYVRAKSIISNVIDQVYMEVFSDGSAAIYKGTAGEPSIGSGDTRNMTITIAPDFLYVVQKIYDLTEEDKKYLDTLVGEMKEIYKTKDKAYDTLNLYTSTGGDSNTVYSLIIDTLSIPTIRQKFSASNK